VASDVIAQYNHSVPVTPSDTVDFERPSDALFVGGAGIVAVVWENGRVASFTCVAGQILPFKVRRVNAATTSATLMNALYRV
jgi:hypothetical protein